MTDKMEDLVSKEIATFGRSYRLSIHIITINAAMPRIIPSTMAFITVEQVCANNSVWQNDIPIAIAKRTEKMPANILFVPFISAYLYRFTYPDSIEGSENKSLR